MRSLQRISFKAIAVASVIVLASCGGGDDDEAGGPTPFNVVPESFGYKGDATGCVMGTAADRFVINGGAAPYKAQSTSPGVVTLYSNDPAGRAETMTNIPKGGSVRIYFEGGCTTEDGTTILVTDSLNVQFTVTVTNTVDDAT